MGIKNVRAICPNCGGKIHTQPKGPVGRLAIGASRMLVHTGTCCELCGAALTGKVTARNYAVLARRAPAAPANETREQFLRRVNHR